VTRAFSARRLRAAALGLAALAVLAGGTITLAKGQPGSAAAVPLALPASPAPAFAIPRPQALETSAHATRWAPVLRAVGIRTEPDPAAPGVGHLHTVTPEGTENIAPVLGRRQHRSGVIWIRVRAPALPENVEGWVPRSALGGYTLVRTRLVVELERLRATLYEDGRRVFRAPIGVGKAGSPTPRGEFFVRNVLTDYDSLFYGPIAFGTSARSVVLTDWPAGGFVGIHGTSRPELLPGRVSHGCIRLQNADILRLARLMPVGTPITIR
jgi:lipoprotein-anchoring transpeptidase ErfK/SrfK